jgi:hypothetical protein
MMRLLAALLPWEASLAREWGCFGLRYLPVNMTSTLVSPPVSPGDAKCSRLPAWAGS